MYALTANRNLSLQRASRLSIRKRASTTNPKDAPIAEEPKSNKETQAAATGIKAAAGNTKNDAYII